jgi:hypothetical protein
MLKKITGKRAYSLAETHQPIAWQGFRWWADYPTEISFDDPKKVVLEAMSKPPVAYYWVRTDGKDYYYIGYGIFHLLDWSPFPGNLLPGEEHKFDFEGILIRVPYYLPHCKPKGPIEHITVFHKALWAYKEDYEYVNPRVLIESGGHGIRYIGHEHPDVTLKIEKWCLLPFDPIMSNPKRREIIRQNFNNCGVNLPDQWCHHGQYKGWFWTLPDALFKEMGK